MNGRVERCLVSVAAVAWGLVACAGTDDGGGSARPSVTATATTSPAGSVPAGPASSAPVVPPAVPEGFEIVSALVAPADGGTPCEVCLWVADTDELHRRGLMGVTDLGGPDGMAFVYGEPRTTSFTMRNTVMELSIAFYDADGTYIDAFDMEPCRSEPCPSYPTPSGFSVAVEVPRGQLEQLAMVPGSRLELLALAGQCDTPSSH